MHVSNDSVLSSFSGNSTTALFIDEISCSPCSSLHVYAIKDSGFAKVEFLVEKFEQAKLSTATT